MRPVSEKFLSSIRGEHGAVVEAWVVPTGQIGASPAGTEILVLGGDIQLDGTAAIRSTLDLDTDGNGFLPDNRDDIYAPYGDYEIFVRRGIVFGGGDVEWVSLGYHGIHDVVQTGSANAPLRITAYDRMKRLVDGRLGKAVQFVATATYGSVVDTLVKEICPWATIEWDDATDTDFLGRALIADVERYDFLDDLITSLGKIWFWDHRGVLVIKDLPAEDEPVWDINAGENGVLVSISRELSREGVYNGVKASGEALDTVAPAMAIAVDNNPNSPTYWYGNFGKVIEFYVSPFITNNTQALSAAQSLLRKKLGLPYLVSFGVVPNAALEPYDAVSIKFNSAPAQVHVLEKITIPLALNQPMTGETRKQTLVVMGEI